jgi:glycosyltransferase involved in cell wall biosynthesis
MKITYDYQTFSIQKYGGVSRYFYELASRLSTVYEFDVDVLAFFYINQYLKTANSGLVIGIERYKIPKTTEFFLGLNKNLCKIWLRYQIPDIFHETYYSTSSLAPKGCKTVLTVHDMIHEKIINGSLVANAEVTNAEITTKQKEMAIKRADHIICVSESTRKDLLEITNIDSDKVSVIHIGHSFSNAPYINEGKQFDPYILYVGLRSSYKNFETLLRAYAASSKIKNDFKLFCFGIEQFSAYELSLIYELGLNEEQVVYMGSQDDKLHMLYRKAAVFVYPSLYEGFGIPPLEAMSLGCPVACSNVSSIPEVVGDAAEFFDPYDIESVILALENVLYSAGKRENLINKGKDRAKQFTWEKCAKNTAKLYALLC